MRGHSGLRTAPREMMTSWPGGLTCSGPRRQAAFWLPPTTSPSTRWRAYMAAVPRRQARYGAFRIDIVGYFWVDRIRLVPDSHAATCARI